MKKLCLLSILLVGCLNCACSDDEECTHRDMAICTEDGLGVKYCLNGKWHISDCATGTSCVSVDDMVQCFDISGFDTMPDCQPGMRNCVGAVVQICTDERQWRYEMCPTGQSCQNGQCSGGVNPQPVDPQPKTYHGIASRECGEDGKSIVTTNADDTKTTASCLELVGFDTQCETYANGHVGCAMPENCNEIFSEAGTCQENRLFGCDTRFINPRPYEMDCAAVGASCVVHAGKASCMELCKEVSDFACVSEGDAEQVWKCTSISEQNVRISGNSLCKDDSTMVACLNGEVQETACGEGAVCLESTGLCAQTCTESELGARICSDSGQLLECQAISDGFAYLSLGNRHCDDDMLYQCEKQQDEHYQLKSVDCANYDKDGTVIHGKCFSDYQGIPDADLCIGGAEGEPCGDLTSDGRCDGNTLEYCDELYEIASSSDCGDAVCSVYTGYADCRSSCDASGAASCTYVESYAQYVLSLCAPDDVNGTLTRIDGTGICLGDILYTCDAQGQTQTTNCALNGGICDTNSCVYPACSLNAQPTCFADNAILACSIDHDGTVIGSTLETMVCSDGKCQVCRDGELVAK